MIILSCNDEFRLICFHFLYSPFFQGRAFYSDKYQHRITKVEAAVKNPRWRPSHHSYYLTDADSVVVELKFWSILDKNGLSLLGYLQL